MDQRKAFGGARSMARWSVRMLAPSALIFAVSCATDDGSPPGGTESDWLAGLTCDPQAAPIPCSCGTGSWGMQSCQMDGTYTVCAGCGMTSGEGSMGNLPVSPPPTPTIDPMEPDPMEPDPMEPDPGQIAVPATPHCAPAASWDAAWTEWENEVLRLTNQRRAQGADCGSQGMKPPVGPLTMVAELRCAARLHSLDMFQRSFFDHTAPGGSDPGDRMSSAGYSGITWGENIAMGQASPAQVVDGWIDSDGHCANIMRSNFTEIGIGYHPGDAASGSFRNRHYWTQNFGARRAGR
jgi:uncharacterized protein YkwD